MKKFYKGHNIEILQFLARAYYKCGMLKKAKLSLLKVSTFDEFNVTPILLSLDN